MKTFYWLIYILAGLIFWSGLIWFGFIQWNPAVVWTVVVVSTLREVQEIAKEGLVKLRQQEEK